MDKADATGILRDELSRYRRMPYAALVNMIDAEPVVAERAGPSGVLYQLEVEAFWDDAPRGDVRVIGSIDDGGVRAFAPLCDTFIKNSEDQFVGE